MCVEKSIVKRYCGIVGKIKREPFGGGSLCFNLWGDGGYLVRGE